MTREETFEVRYAELASGKRQEAGSDFRDRAKGALWGLVIGDCLGSPRLSPLRRPNEKEGLGMAHQV